MKFDSNRAWQEALASVSANRVVLIPLAGVFFLLPGLASALFLSDVQESMLANLGNQAATEQLMQGALGRIMSIGLISFVLQIIGYMALLALLTDRGRPTVGEALMIALKALPTLIGTVLLFFVAYLLSIVVFGMFAAALGAVSGLGAIVVALFLLFFAAIVYSMVKLSLTLPVIVIDKELNPVAALLRSWRLTKGNSLRLFGFYLLLFVIYFVIILLVGGLVMTVATLAAGKGVISLLIGGLVSGAIGAVASVLLTAILASVHRQLAGPSAEALGATFE